MFMMVALVHSEEIAIRDTFFLIIHSYYSY